MFASKKVAIGQMYRMQLIAYCVGGYEAYISATLQYRQRKKSVKQVATVK